MITIVKSLLKSYLSRDILLHRWNKINIFCIFILYSFNKLKQIRADKLSHSWYLNHNSCLLIILLWFQFTLIFHFYSVYPYDQFDPSMLNTMVWNLNQLVDENDGYLISFQNDWLLNICLYNSGLKIFELF